MFAYPMARFDRLRFTGTRPTALAGVGWKIKHFVD